MATISKYGGRLGALAVIVEVQPGVVLVGTAHVSAKSVEDVETTIRERRPKKVLVELDARRLEALQDPDKWAKTDIIEVIRSGKQHLFMLQLYLANMQARFGKAQGVQPGADMLRAVEVAKEIGAEVVLIDRDVGITLKRGFTGMGFWARLGLAMNFVMELFPNPPPAERRTAKARATMNALVAGGLLGFLAWPSTQERAWGIIDRVLDALIGFSMLPLATILLAALIGGGLWLWGQTPRPPDGRAGAPPATGDNSPTWELRARVPLAATLLGILLAWTYLFTNGASPTFLAEAFPIGPARVGVLAAAAAAVFGGVAGYRISAGARRLSQQRAAVAGRPEMDIDALLETDAVTAMTEEFAQFAPEIKEALIDERDVYMASHIQEQGSDVVAVVGAGHVPGIQRHLQAGAATDRSALDAVRKRRFSVGKFIGIAIPAAILGIFVYLGVTGQFATLGENLRDWFLINGTLAAVGALLARGHILSILTAFVAAPITSLNPFLAAGWFAGAVEAKVRTPTVKDFQAIKDIETMKAFWQNPVVRVLLVTALANLGSVFGTWIAGARILQSVVG